jgi:hypothetical protein
MQLLKLYSSKRFCQNVNELILSIDEAGANASIFQAGS